MKLINQCKRYHFDKLNYENNSKPFCESCKPYFSNKHFSGDFSIALCENDELLNENNKIAEMLFHLIYLVGPHNLMLVRISFKKSS